MSIYKKASLAMIPSGYKSGKVYNVIPKKGDMDFTEFTRSGSTGSRLNKDGLIEKLDANVPRLDYPMNNGLLLNTPFLLLEPASTNQIVNSDTSDFSLTNTTRSSANNYRLGTIQGYEYTIGTGTPQMNIVSYTTTAVNQYVTFSFFIDVSYLTNTTIYLGSAGNKTQGTFAVWTKSTSSFSDPTENTTYVTATSTKLSFVRYKDNMYRFSISAEFKTSSTITFPHIEFTGGDEPIFIGGAQVEQKSFATSFIDTTGSTAIRNNESGLKSVESAGDPAINSVLGVILFEIESLVNDATHKYMSISDDSNQNYIHFGFNNQDNTITVVVQKGSGAPEVTMNLAVTSTLSINKVAFLYQENNFKLAINGSILSTDNSGQTFPVGTLNTIRFDSPGESSSSFYGKVRQFMLFDELLTDQELISLTGEAPVGDFWQFNTLLWDSVDSEWQLT